MCLPALSVSHPMGLRGGQEVELDVDLLPEAAQDLALLAGVVVVVEGVAAHQVVVLRLDGGLVVLPVGA